MRRAVRYSFNALTVLSLALCVATTALWVRSYSVTDSLYFQKRMPNVVWIESKDGALSVWDVSYLDQSGRLYRTSAIARLMIPYVLASTAFAIPPFIGLLVRWRIACRAIRRGICRRCGYDLTGNVSGVCPECGTKVGSPG